MKGSWRLPAAGAVATSLSAICLGATFLTGAWFVPAVFGVVLAVGTAELARRFGVPRALVPVAALAVLLCYLVARYARGEALLGVLPDRGALAQLAQLVRDGNEDISRLAAPIDISPGIELIAVAGVGLVAVAVDTLAVTLRRAALAGLPLLALYTVPVSVAPDGVSWEAFALGGAGYLGLLLAESRERLSRWGRPLRFSATRADWAADVETAPLTQVGRRVGAAALGLALVVPAVLPTIDASTFGIGGTGFGRGNGGGDRVAVLNPILDLGKDLRRDRDRAVIRYKGDRTYLRMVGLDVFTGDTWRPSQLRVPKEQNVANGLPGPPGLGAGVQQDEHRYDIEVFDLEQQWLPLPYPAEKVSIDGRWVYDTSTFNVFSVNSSTRQQTYEVTSRAVEPTPAQLRAAPEPPESVRKYLQLPADMPPVVERTAKEVTRAATTHYDQALALQTWLRDPNEFTYSTDVANTIGDANGARAIAAFLASRRGYCIHFASAMAVMARQLGIPARVAVGFTPGTQDDQGRFVVGLHDAHAWPELYFEGAGWLAFEPTPPVRTGQPPSWARPQAAPIGGSQQPSTSPTPSSSASAPNSARIHDPDLLRPPAQAAQDQNVL
ncbi:MAG: transglutaminase family protein, partial [Nocardioidaceae bacterium]